MPCACMVISLGILTRQWGRQESTYLYSICNVTVVTFNFDRKVIITTGKFDIHEVQLKNIPVKNDSGVSSNSHRKITNGHNKQAAKYSIPGMYHFFTFPLPTHLGPPPVQSHYYQGQTSKPPKMTFSFKSPNSSFSIPYPPLLPAPINPTFFG